MMRYSAQQTTRFLHPGSSSSHVRGGQYRTSCLIFIDAKDSNPVQLWQLGNKHGQERGCVEDKVCRIILCIETRQEVAAGEKGESLADGSLV